MAGSGEVFQQDFVSSLKQPDVVGKVSWDRFYVPRAHKGVRAVSDYVLYLYPHQYYMELKATKGLRLPFSNITDGQWLGLAEKSRIPGVFAGFLISFYDVGRVFWVDVRDMADWRIQGHRSVSLEMAQWHGFEMFGSRRRTRWIYDVVGLLQAIARHRG